MVLCNAYRALCPLVCRTAIMSITFRFSNIDEMEVNYFKSVRNPLTS